jgi:cytochrome c peroxidase
MFASQYLGSQDLEIEGADVEGEGDAPNGVKYVKLQPRKSAEIKFTSAQAGTFAAGQTVFFGKGICASCHVPPLLHRQSYAHSPGRAVLQADADQRHDGYWRRFHETFPLRGVKNSPPSLHDRRLLTLDDAVEFFDLILQAQLTVQAKKDLVAFLRVL